MCNGRLWHPRYSQSEHSLPGAAPFVF